MSENQQDTGELDRMIQELKIQVEVNRRLARAFLDVRLELEQLKIKHVNK